MKPFQQGSLDALCGVYAVINAFRLLCPEIDRRIARILFEALIEAVSEAGLDMPDVVVRGMDHDAIGVLTEAARHYVRREVGIRIAVHALKIMQKRPRLAHVWSALQSEFDGGRVAIIGLEGRHQHWTVGHRITGAAIALSDSDGLCLLLRSRCSVNGRTGLHQLVPREIVILERVDW